MAARSGDGNQPQEHQQQQEPAVNGGEDFPEEHLPPVVEAGGQEQAGTQQLPGERTPDRPPAPSTSSAGSPRRATTVARLSFRALRLWRRLTVRLLQWFAARPLGQRALEAVGHTIATAEQATLWAGAATRQGTDRPSLPFAWYFMMPVVMGLMVVRTGAALAERYLNVQLPQNRELVNWFQTQRIHLEQLQTEAAANIRIVYLDQYDSKPSFLDTWPFNIPFWAAQQLGIVPVFVKQSSDTSSDSTSVPTVEPATSASSGSSTLTEAEEHAEPSSRELTPPPEAALDRTLYFSPVDERQAKEESEEKEEQQQGKQQEDKSESAQEQTEQPTVTEEEAVGAATAVVSPQPSPPPEHKELEDKERSAMGEVPPPPPQPTSEDLLAAERTSSSAPATTSGVRKTVAKSSKTSFLVNLFATKLA